MGNRVYSASELRRVLLEWLSPRAVMEVFRQLDAGRRSDGLPQTPRPTQADREHARRIAARWRR